MVTKKNSTPATMQAMPEAEQRNTESAPVTAPATPEPAYRPGTLKPTTDKEWAYANFPAAETVLGRHVVAFPDHSLARHEDRRGQPAATITRTRLGA